MRTLLLGILTFALLTTAFAEVNVPVQKLQPAATAGFAATCKTAADGVTVTFKKTGEERRFLALQGVPAGNPAGAKTAEIAYNLTLASGAAPRAAILIYEKGGGSWYKIGALPVAVGANATTRVSVAALQQTAFSTSANKQLAWDQAERVWAGFVFDGAAEGKLTVTAVKLTDQAALPTQPLRLTGADQGKWSAGQDAAVKSKLEMTPDGPKGGECLKFTFTVPAGRHMFAIPSTNVAVEDLEGYTALRFKYRYQLPPGMRMLISLGEAGGPMYFVEPAGPWSAEWAEMTIPLSKFQWASWSQKDDNGQFDLAKLTTVQIGTHGVPAQAGDGSIMVCDVELVP